MKKHNVLLIFVVLLLLAGSATAWVGSSSSQVLAVDDQTTCTAGRVCSSNMGYVNLADYTQTFTRIRAQDLDAASLAGKDTVFLYAVLPTNLNAGAKTALVNFVTAGGKLIIWDGEDVCATTTCSASNPGINDYTWLGDFSFRTFAPGPFGASGPLYPLFIEEENQLSTFGPGPFQILNKSMEGTDAIGDANIFGEFQSTHWCLDMTGKNVFTTQGPVHIYSKDFGTSGIVMYSGLDWDDAGNYVGYPPGENGLGNELKKMLQQELNANNLPCTKTNPGVLDVTKTADQTTYNVGDTITFTITVRNPTTFTSYRTNIKDTPPAGVTCPNPEILVGTLGPGLTDSQTLICTATAASCQPIINKVDVVGYSAAQGGAPIFSGYDEVEFTIDGPACGPVNAPEFPTLALPIGMIIGIVFIVYSVKRKE